jgi:hypothetical protein
MFYVVKGRRSYFVCEATPENLFMRTKDDPTRHERRPTAVVRDSLTAVSLLRVTFERSVAADHLTPGRSLSHGQLDDAALDSRPPSTRLPSSAQIPNAGRDHRRLPRIQA